MLLGNVPASGSVNFTLGHTPQFVGIRFGATGTLASVTFTGPHGIQVNLNEAAVKALGQAMALTSITPTNDIYLIPIAAGFIGGEETSLTVTAGAGVGGVDVYDISTVGNPSGLKFCCEMIGVLANGSMTFDKFSKLIFLSPASTDVINIIPSDGTVGMQVQPLEVAAISAIQFNNDTDVCCFNNTDQLYKAVTYSPSANRTAVKVYMMAGGSTTSKGITEVVTKNLIDKTGGNQRLLEVADRINKTASVNLK